MVTTTLDLLAVAAVGAFAWFLWPPLVLLVLAGAALIASKQASR